jgi:hypothetical protein
MLGEHDMSSNPFESYRPSPKPKRNDEANARRWRGPLFENQFLPLVWRNKDGSYQTLRGPRSVTFPICDFCGHVIWEWPHFEEQVPEGAVCDQCFREEDERGRGT